MSAHGKHTQNPGYEPGNHWVVCDVCGFDIRAEDIKERWDGLMVCPSDWEPRHPQDFVRATEEDTSTQGPIRTEPSPNYITDLDDSQYTKPSGTFNEDTL